MTPHPNFKPSAVHVASRMLQAHKFRARRLAEDLIIVFLAGALMGGVIGYFI